MNKLELFGSITDAGELQIHNKQRLKEWARQFPGRNVVIKFERAGSKRTSPANRYYWGVVISEISIRLRDLGHQWLTNEDVHDMMKLKFNHEQIVSEHGEVLELPKSTTTLTKMQFAEYIDNIRMWASSFLSIDIPDPNSDLKMQF